MACRAISCPGKIRAARRQIGVGKVSWGARWIRSLEIRKFDSLALGKSGGIARAKYPPGCRQDCQEGDHQNREINESAHLSARPRLRRPGMTDLPRNSMRGAIDP